jgi:surface antigen
MKASHFLRVGWAILLASALISCGGGGGGYAGGGIDGSGFVSQGSVSAIGSIVVNGGEFDTTNAAVIINGEEAGVGDEVLAENLDVGKVVIVEGRRVGEAGTLVADRVVYSETVRGPVKDILAASASLKQVTVMGQQVLVNAVTLFKDTTFDSLAVDDILEVSGFFDHTGAIWATFVQKTGVIVPDLEVEVKGFVTNLDDNLKTFRINGLTVVYASADTTRLPDGTLSDGLLVEVQGLLDGAGTEMSATEVRLGDEFSIDDVDDVEVTGFVTALDSLAEFTVGNRVVRVDGQTVFVDGVRENIVLGVKVEVEGALVNGVLHAREVEFWAPNQVEVEGGVTDIVSLTEFTVGNQVVQTDSATVFVGGTPAQVALGVLLEVKGVPIDIARSLLAADKVSFEPE